MNAAELFIKCLRNEGVRYIFGVPGEENAHFVIALEDSEIELVLTRHEQGAAFMADVYGRLTGKAGVCLGTLGPGATNLVTGVANGNMDHAPMVVLTGQADSQRQHKESHQNMDVVELFQPITKWSTPILHPDNLPEIVAKAFKLAEMEKPGACHIELAEDVAEMEASVEPLRRSRLRRPVPDDKIIDQAVAMLREAKRPIVLAGNGAVRRRASDQLRRFTQLTGIGVINTFMGKGALSRHDPHCLFTIGLQAKDITNCAIDASDLVITIGYDLVEYHPRFWNSDGNKKIIHLDFHPAEVDAHYTPDAEVVGDLSHALWMLNERLTTTPTTFDLSGQKQAREQMLADFAKHKDDDTEGSLRPQKVLWDVREALGAEDILLSDVGAHKMWIARYYQCEAPNTCLIPNGFCSMGFALPGAIAAAIAEPSRNVLAICGDGGFLMNVQEMETAVRLGLKLVVMVWVDGGYGLISWKQQNEFGRQTKLEFGNPDFSLLAQSFGWNAHLVENSRDLAASLNQALAEDGPSLISLPIDYRENAKLTARLGEIVCPI